MNEKINKLIEFYITLRREDPKNENEVYKWYAIAHFQQYWNINAADFYKMFKEAFREKNNLVDYRPFGILEALGENYPTKLKELLGIVYGADDFYTKLGKCRTFSENVIDDLKEKSNTNFSSKIDERTLSFLLTLKFPNEHTFYKRDIYTRLCEYLGEVSRKEHKYEHFIELLTEITTYFNNPELKQLTSNFIPQGFDEPLLLAQDIVYQNMTISSEKAFRNVLDKIPKHWASVFFYKLGNIIEDLALEDTENQVFSVRLDEKSLRYHIGKRVCLSVSPKEFLFITGKEVDIPKLRREEFERPNNAFLYYQGTPQHIKEYYSDIKNAIKEEIKLDKETYPKSYDNTYFREYIFSQKYKEEFEITENNMTNQAIDLTTINLLRYKPQIILQGPPGTGKTREAKRIAKALLGLGENDSLEGNEQFKLIQFHPSYSYEDFVRGIIAENTDGNISYVTKDKILAEFAKKALKDKDTPYVLIIDEINRANLSAVLGELIYALEYRGEAVQSMYAIEGENNLILPPNLYIIGTMNTADRSVGHIDYAIRRRFAFVNVLPNELEKDFHKELFRAVSELFISNYDEYISNPDIELKRALTLSNEFKSEDVWLGHSYFITKNTPIDIRWEYEIKPILLEYIKDGILINDIKIGEQMQKIKKIVYENNAS